MDKCQPSSSFTDQEWVIIEPSHTKKEENLSHDRGLKDKYWMVYSINATTGNASTQTIRNYIENQTGK